MWAEGCALSNAPVRKIGLLYFQAISSTSLQQHKGH